MELPADIRETATKLVNEVGAGLAIGSAETIARALLAERLSATERAAKIAEAYQGYDDDLQRSAGGRTAGGSIAAAIRSQP